MDQAVRGLRDGDALDAQLEDQLLDLGVEEEPLIEGMDEAYAVTGEEVEAAQTN